MTTLPIDPVCLLHGVRRSEHVCLYCCLCYRDLTYEECHLLPDGSREDICNECAKLEEDFIKNGIPPSM